MVGPRDWLGGVTDLGAWDRIGLDELGVLFADVPAPWWLAGGYAVELAVGTPFREHGDVDVLALRSSLDDLREALSGWDLHAADPPGTLRPWPVTEVLPAHVHDVFCRRTPSSPWSFQFMVDDTDGPGSEQDVAVPARPPRTPPRRLARRTGVAPRPPGAGPRGAAALQERRRRRFGTASEGRAGPRPPRAATGRRAPRVAGRRAHAARARPPVGQSLPDQSVPSPTCPPGPRPSDTNRLTTRSTSAAPSRTASSTTAPPS